MSVRSPRAPGSQKYSDAIDSRNGLLEQFQTLGDELGAETGQPGDIAAGPRKVRDESALNRITNISEDDGDSLRRLHGGQRDPCASTDEDDINLELDQFARKGGEALARPLAIAVLKQDIVTVDVTELTQSLEEGVAQLRVRGQAGR